MYASETELKKILTYEIEQVFGRKIISSRDCIELSEDIFSKTKHQLNANTLRRFFNLVKATYPPSKSTLTILSRYCGFQSADDIYKIKNTASMAEGTINPNTILHYLVSLFREIEMADMNDVTFIHMVVHTIKLLNANKFLTDRFQSLIAKTHNGNVYFEQLVNVDKLNSFYGNGLRYYLKERGNRQAEIFTHSLYIFKYWLSNEEEKLLKSAEVLPDTADKSWPYYITARFFAARLFLLQTLEQDATDLLADIHQFYGEFKETDDQRQYQFSYILSQALLLTGHDNETIYFINESKKINNTFYTGNHPLNNSQNFALLEAFALCNTGNAKTAEKIFTDVKSPDFPILEKRLFYLLYLLLAYKLKFRNAEKTSGQLKKLVSETGFKKFLSFIDGAQK